MIYCEHVLEYLDAHWGVFVYLYAHVYEYLYANWGVLFINVRTCVFLCTYVQTCPFACSCMPRVFFCVQCAQVGVCFLTWLGTCM